MTMRVVQGMKNNVPSFGPGVETQAAVPRFLDSIMRASRGVCVYVLWTWVPVLLMFVAHLLHQLLGCTHSFWNPFLPIALNGIFTAGMAVYLGVQIGAGHELVPRRHLLHGAGAVLNILVAEAGSGLLYCLGLTAYAKLYGIGVLKPGAATESVYLTLSLEMLPASLIAGMISCTLGCAIGAVAGATLRAGDRPSTNRKSAWRWNSTRAVAIIAGGFMAINVAGLYGKFTTIMPLESVWGNAQIVRLVEASMALTSLLGDNIWVCIAVLWFLWLRGCSNIPGWQRWFLFALLFGLGAFFLLPML